MGKSFDNNMSNKEIGEKYGIHPRDVEKIKFAFEVYDFKGDGKVDAFYIGDLIRACNLNPTNNTIYNMCGGLQEKSKKMITIDEMYPIFKTAKDSKDTGQARQRGCQPPQVPAPHPFRGRRARRQSHRRSPCHELLLGGPGLHLQVL